jgi:hypothetical protein
VRRELKNFLLLLLSNNATKEELVGVQVIIMPMLNFIENFLCLCKAYRLLHFYDARSAKNVGWMAVRRLTST